jgi:hypothetical protein
MPSTGVSIGRLLTGALAAMILVVVSACRSAGKEHSLPVPECDDYQRAFAVCHGRDPEVAVKQVPTVASSEAERDRLEALCGLNLRRLHNICR